MGGLNMIKLKVANFLLPFYKCFKNSPQLPAEIDVKVMLLQPAYDPQNPDTPISCVAAYLGDFVWGRVGECIGICVRIDIYETRPAQSYIVGVSRSSSLTINHHRQLISAKSACERAVFLCICLCAFDCSFVITAVLEHTTVAAE